MRSSTPGPSVQRHAIGRSRRSPINWRVKRTYALEGAIFIAGAAVQWLRDGLKLIAASSDIGSLAGRADPAEQVYLVPAFVGLGAPYWDAQARGAIFGLTRNSGAAELARATLELVGYQTRDLLEAMSADWPASKSSTTVLRVDGGMTASDLTMQFLADILASPVDRPKVMETMALGARLPGAPPGSALIWRASPRNGVSTVALNRAWMRKRGSESIPAGAMPSGAP